MKKIIKILLIILLIFFLIYYLFNFVYVRFLRKYNFEKSSITISNNYNNSPFSISKIIMYSSSYAQNKNNSYAQRNLIFDIMQYTDIAIYIDNNNNNNILNETNSVKKLYIENIKISSPKLGSTSIYYLDSLNFGTNNVNTDYEISDSLEFTVLNDSNEQKNIGSNTPVFFTDCSNPITLKYVNWGIKENYTIASNEPIIQNGKLLEMANISLNNLETNIDLQIKIESNDNKKYLYQLKLPINLKNQNATIYDGSILIKNNYKKLKFMLIE